jgi:hypothetical protein
LNAFEQLDTAIIQPDLPITPEDTAFSDEELEDKTALAIVLRDIDTAAAFLQSKSLTSEMDQADDIYRAWVEPRTWPNGKPRSSLSYPIVLEIVEKILPSIQLTLWGSRRDPFELQAIGNTTPETARAKGHVLSWALRQAKTKEQIRLMLKNILIYGYGVGNWGWESKTKQIKKYVRDKETGKIRAERTTVVINQPCFRNMPLRRVLIDPSCETQDVTESAGYVALQFFITADDLDGLRDDPQYKNVPTRDELREILTQNPNVTHDSMRANKSNSWRDLQAEQDAVVTTVDPLEQPLEIIEYWRDDKVISVLNRVIVIRNDENEYGRKTQVSCAFIDVPHSFWGFGIAKLAGGDQRFAAGVRNSWVDSLSLSLNPMFQQVKGVGMGTQQIPAEPGRVVTVTSKLESLTPPSVTPEATNSIEFADAHANRVAGSSGGSNMPGSAMRTAAGVNSFSADVTQRLEYFLEIFCDLVFEPVLTAFLEMCCDKLEPAQINEILVEAEGKAWQGDVLDIYNAKAKIDLACAGKLSARVAATNLVPQIITLLSNAAVQQSFNVQGVKFDYANFAEQVLELQDWDAGALIVPMTKEDQQRVLQQNPAAIKAASDQQLAAQVHQNDLEDIDRKAMAQGTIAVIKQAAKVDMDRGTTALESAFGANPSPARQ